MNETLRQKCHPYSILTSRLKYEWLVYWVFFFYSIGIFSIDGFWIVISIASIKSLMQQPCLIWCNGTKFILNEALLHESIHFFISHSYSSWNSWVTPIGKSHLRWAFGAFWNWFCQKCLFFELGPFQGANGTPWNPSAPPGSGTPNGISTLSFFAWATTELKSGNFILVKTRV